MPLSDSTALAISVAAPRMMSPRAGPHHAHAGLADQHALDAERGQQRHVDPPQARAGKPQLKPGGGVGVRRQHAFAGRDRGERLDLRAAHLHGIERRHRVGARRHRIAGIDARRRGRQRRRRVGRRRASHRSARHSRRAARARPWDGPPRSPRWRRASGRAPSTRLPRAARPARPTGRSLPARRRAGSAAQSAGFRNPQPCGELDAIRPGCPVSRDHGQETEPMAESKAKNKAAKTCRGP